MRRRTLMIPLLLAALVAGCARTQTPEPAVQGVALAQLGGLLTLGLQVNPDATFADLWRALAQTAARNARGVPMLNPAAYIAAVRR